MAEGWISLHRQLFDNELWTKEPFSRGQAWVDLLLLANHKEGSICKRGIKITVPRGCVGWSQRKLAERWRWSREKTTNFMRELKAERMIEIYTKTGPQTGPQNSNVTSLIAIVNYDRYQCDQATDRATNQATDRAMNNNDKQEKTISASDDAVRDPVFLTRKRRSLKGKRLTKFEEFWEAFAYKKGKAEAADSWLDLPPMTDALCARIIEAARGEAAARPKLIADGRTPKMAQGWLTARRWEDEHTEGGAPCSMTPQQQRQAKLQLAL